LIPTSTTVTSTPTYYGRVGGKVAAPAAHESYTGVANTSTVFKGNKGSTTTTMQAGETACPPAPALFSPGRADDACSYNHLWSAHTGGANFAMGDGSVRFFPYTASAILLPLSTRSGGEVPDLSGL